MRLDILSKVLKRLRSPPGVVLSLCAGLCVELYVMLELGYQVKTVLVVESSEFLCKMLKQVHGPLIQVISRDVTTLSIEELLDWVEEPLLAGFAGPTCTPWSSLREDDLPKGCDDPKAMVFMACAGLFKQLAEYHRLSQSMLETVCIRKDRAGDLAQQESAVGGEMHMWNACDSGSAASRPRMYHVRGMRMSKLTRIEHVNPSLMLALGWRLEKEPAPCLVSAKDTKSPA